ncbi:MAG: ABC transporter ATP-binding protein [bacterium]|nr:ABC transporter ATP-binding protein [bacterium]
MLTLNAVHTYYGEVHILRGVSLAVAEGQVTALLGRNGMGKSTTVHTIMGFVPPRAGAITLNGAPVHGKKPNDIAQMGISIVPQGKRIFPSLSVRENLTVAARPNRPNCWTLADIFRLFPVLEKRQHVVGTALSGGEQQMLALARALSTGPDVILMDEPSEGLAPMLVERLVGAIHEMCGRGMAILLVEQNLPFALACSHHVYVMSRGEIVYDAPPDELRTNETIKTQHLGASV